MEKFSDFKNKKEYVIWGIPDGKNEETILLTSVEGKPITSKQDALKYQNVLETKFKATKCRIQEIDFNKNIDFSKVIKK